MSKSLLLCIASSRLQAETIMHRLEAESFADDRISVVFPNKGALTLAGLGSFIAAGPLIDDLQRASHDSSAEIDRGLMSLGVSETTARHCREQLERGNFLISTHVANGEEASRAKKIFTELGGQDICGSSEADSCVLETGGRVRTA